jgi:hypothetical protein
MISDFDTAGEYAFLVDLSYHFKGVGLDGLSSYVRYASGWNLKNPSKGRVLPDESEFDVGVDYRFKKGPLRNFWIRVQEGLQRQKDTGSSNNFRVILNYDVAVF